MKFVYISKEKSNLVFGEKYEIRMIDIYCEYCIVVSSKYGHHEERYSPEDIYPIKSFIKVEDFREMRINEIL